MGGTAVSHLQWTLPDDQELEAPGDLAVIEAFLNTVDLESGAEDFATPEALADWLRARGLLTTGERIDGKDLERAISVRESLRKLLLANHDGVDAPTDALATLQHEADALTIRMDLTADHAHLRPSGEGLDRVIGILLAIVFHAMHDGTWSRMKACRNDTCQWAFYDSSRNRSGKWCSMAICGNRAKVASYRERHS